MNNIILPIHPEYVEKILMGDKKYEYRKKLCKEDIEKIYIYSTTPIKKIVGEVEVIKKINKPKEQLWQLTCNDAGIEKKLFDLYFKKNEYACAYCLGKVKKYKNRITLEEIGINYSPQAYVYCGDLNL